MGDDQGNGVAKATSTGARIRRTRPERSQPLRSPAGFVQADRNLDSSPDRDGSPADAGSPTDGVSIGVRLGYEVIDEYLRQAKGLAGSMSPDAQRPFTFGQHGLSGNMEKLAGESMLYYRQFVDTWLRMLTTLGQQVLGPGTAQSVTDLWGMGPPAGNNDTPSRGHQAEPRAEGAFNGRDPDSRRNGPDDPTRSGWQEERWEQPPAAPQRGSTVALSVRAAHGASVSLDLLPGIDTRNLAAHPLRSLDTTAPVIDDVEFREQGSRMVLHVGVSDGLPPGTYAAAVVDRTTGAPCGTVSVEIAPQDA